MIWLKSPKSIEFGIIIFNKQWSKILKYVDFIIFNNCSIGCF